jgi:hypothetical protein
VSRPRPRIVKVCRGRIAADPDVPDSVASSAGTNWSDGSVSATTWHADAVSEERLTGGNNVHEVVRVGDTVRRTRGSQANFAARVLIYLESVDYLYAPRYLGIDERDRDMLTFIPGRTTDHPSQRSLDACALGGKMLRELHDTTTGSDLAGGQECVIHGDPGPFNTIFRYGRPIALIDWDSCRPGRRIDDLAYMGWTWCVQSLGHIPISQQAGNLRELRDGYGSLESEELIEAIMRRQAQIAKIEAVNAANPALGPIRRRHAERAVAWAMNDRELVKRNKKTFLAALE